MNAHQSDLGALAARQHGLLTRTQILSHGLTERQIGVRLGRGDWQLVGRNTYRIAGAPPTWRQAILAACLAGPPGTVASWHSAAALAGLAPPPGRVHVTVPYQSSARSRIATVHRARLTPIDTMLHDGIPATTVERTLVDLAWPYGPKRLQKLVDTAAHERGLRPAAVDRAWERSQRAPGRKGEAKLLAALEPWRATIRPGSPAEAKLARVLMSWGLPEPEMQIPVLSAEGEVIGRIDLGWRSRVLGIEYEGQRHHDPTTWAADMARDARIRATGWRLVYADKADLRPGDRSLRDTLQTLWYPASHIAA